MATIPITLATATPGGGFPLYGGVVAEVVVAEGDAAAEAVNADVVAVDGVAIDG